MRLIDVVLVRHNGKREFYAVFTCVWQWQKSQLLIFFFLYILKPYLRKTILQPVYQFFEYIKMIELQAQTYNSVRRSILNPCSISTKESQKRKKKKEKRHTCTQTFVVILMVLVTIKTNKKVGTAVEFSQVGLGLMFVESFSKNVLFINVESWMLYTVGFQLRGD